VIYTYRWEALSPAGLRRHGASRAASVPALVDRLRADGLRATRARIDWGQTLRAAAVRRIRRGELATSLAYLADYLAFSPDLGRAVASTAATTQDPRLGRLWAAVGAHLEQGHGLADALAAEPGVPGLVLSAVAAGERTARLREVLAEVAGHLSDDAELLRALRRALTYPVVLLLTTAFVGGGVVFYVLPQIAGALESLGEVPWSTRLVLSAMRASGWLAPVALVGPLLAAGAVTVWARRAPLPFWSTVWRLPVLGRVLRDAVIARFLGNLGLLLDQGLPLLAAVEAAHQRLDSPALTLLTERLRQGLRQGQGLAELMPTPLWPGFVHEAARRAEETGRTAEYLRLAATVLRRRVADRLGRLTQLLEPVLLISIGALVLILALALLLPIYHSLQQLSPYR
jgi:type II secretory pathway component PulF